MRRGKNSRTEDRDALPKEFDSISEAADFWDSHDSADYEDMMEEVKFEVDIKRHIYLVPVAGTLLERLRKRARSEGVSTETYVNVLLQEHG